MGGQMQQNGGQMQQNGGQMMQGGGRMMQGNNQWWEIDDQEDYEAYLKWCEERRMAIQEQEQALLRQIEERAEEKKRETERENAEKVMKARRDNMMAQWKQWQAQLSVAEEFDGAMDKYTEMKIKYMFTLTMDFLKFCRCADYTTTLQRYLYMDGMTYEPSAAEAFSLDELEDVDITSVEAVAQRMAVLSDAEGIKIYFGGIVDTMCNDVKKYVDQLRVWEQQYNFLGV